MSMLRQKTKEICEGSPSSYSELKAYYNSIEPKFKRTFPRLPADTFKYSPFVKILIAGDGDMSYGNSLAIKLGDARNLTVTVKDSFFIIKYKHGRHNLASLLAHGATVIFGVEATKLHEDPRINRRSYGIVEFNQPHAGTFKTEYYKKSIM
ncbi:heavy metal-associated isoprenylated plant protein 41-like [Bidens hawaiensis]|uniref:heavy metal-associated isoprenylated plant protein 41-like n=1 Tax=Bidens hawaiensis TaxID=980011 RepID=UPI0040496A92